MITIAFKILGLLFIALMGGIGDRSNKRTNKRRYK